MEQNDEETLREFAMALEIFPAITDPPSSSTLRAAQIDIASFYFHYDWEDSSLIEEMREHMETRDEQVPLLLLLNLVGGHAMMTLNYAAYELLKDDRLIGWMATAPPELEWWSVDDLLVDIDLGAPSLSTMLPIVWPGQSLKSLVLTSDRPCGPRDHVWLEWNHKLKLTPAKIRDKWNGMPGSERCQFSPKCSDRISDGEPGRDTVKKGLRNASQELKSAGISLDQAFRGSSS